MKNKPENGYIYFIKSGDYYKVGITRNSVSSRLKNYKTHNPEVIEVIATGYTPHYIGMEELILNTYFKGRTVSDWKQISKTSVKEIVKLIKKWDISKQ